MAIYGSINKWYTNWPHFMKPLAKKDLSFPQVLQFVKGDFQNDTLSRATCELHWSWTLWTLGCEYHSAWYVELENIDWRVVFESWHNLRIQECLVWTEYYKNFKLLYIYFWKNMILSPSLCERSRISQPVIW